MHSLELVSQILENTYSHPSPSGTFSLKHNLQGDQLSLNYSTIVHFASETSLRDQLVRLREASAQKVDDALSKLKAEYKDRSGDNLKLEDLGGDDSLELISSHSASPRKVAYFRYKRNISLSS